MLSPHSQIDVYSLFLKKLLQGRVTQSIEDIIKSHMIPMDELQQSVLKYLQDQFNTSTPEDFYKTAQTNKQFLEMLIKYDTSKKHHPRIKDELRLIEICYFLK